MLNKLAINIFGAPDIRIDGEPIRVDTRKAIAMIAYLALNPGPQTRDALATLLWPDLNQSRARAALRRTLSVLKHSGIARWLAIHRADVELEIGSSIEIDVVAFHRLIASCNQHGHASDGVCPRCIEPLTAAVVLYRDDLLAGFTLRDSVNFDDWQFFAAEELRRDYVKTLDRLIDGLAADGQFEDAIVRARQRLRTDPLHEAAHRQLMRLYIWAEQRNAALRQYRECVRILDEELGVPPLDETTELYEIIYGNLPVPKPNVLNGAPSAPTSELQVAAVSAHPGAVVATDLVGRDAAWSMLEQALSTARDGRLVIIEGEAGIGKTALLNNLLVAATERGWATLRAQCYQGESDLAYAPIRELLHAGMALPGARQRLENAPIQWLAEAGKLVPEFGAFAQRVDAQSTPSEQATKGHFFEGVNQVLGALTTQSGLTCVAIDNLHWADNATLELVGYVARRLRERPICLILSWRTEELTAGEPRSLIGIDAIHDVGKTEVALTRLTTEDVGRMLRAFPLVDPDLQPQLAARLMDVSAGIPLFVVEYLALFNQAPTLVDEPDWALPNGIRNLLQSRLDPISDAGRQVLTSAAVIGRAFDYDVLRAVSGRSDDECVQALEELLAQRLVRELGGAEYDFYHDQLRGLVYEQVSRARRRLLHRRVADALATAVRRESGEPRALSGLLAYHNAESGQIEQAIKAYVDAAGEAASVYANHEAIQYLERALALGADEIADIHERLGDLQMILGEYARARNNFELAAARASGSQPARLEGKLGNLHQRLGSLSLAAHHFEAALVDALLEQPWRCRILAQWSLVADRADDSVRAWELAEESLAVSMELGDPRALSEAHNVLSILARHASNVDDTVAYAQRSLNFAEQSASSSARVAALNSLALAQAMAGDYPTAIALTQEALAISLAQGDRHRAAALYNHLADSHHARGEERVAEAQLMQAVQLFAEISADGLDLNPEIWKLTEW